MPLSRENLEIFTENTRTNNNFQGTICKKEPLKSETTTDQDFHALKLQDLDSLSIQEEQETAQRILFKKYDKK